MRVILLSSLALAAVVAAAFAWHAGAASSTPPVRATLTAQIAAPKDLRLAADALELDAPNPWAGVPVNLVGIVNRLGQLASGERYLVVDDWTANQRLPIVQAVLSATAHLPTSKLLPKTPVLVHCPNGVGRATRDAIQLLECSDVRDLRFATLP